MQLRDCRLPPLPSDTLLQRQRSIVVAESEIINIDSLIAYKYHLGSYLYETLSTKTFRTGMQSAGREERGVVIFILQ